MFNWRNNKTEDLFSAFLKLQSADEVAAFCRDLMTPAEIEEFASRWQVAQELAKGMPQRQVSAKTGVSIATVTRVNQWLKRGMDGLQTVLSRLNSKQNHHHQH